MSPRIFLHNLISALPHHLFNHLKLLVPEHQFEIQFTGARKCRLSHYNTLSGRHNHHHSNVVLNEEQDIKNIACYDEQLLEKCISPPLVECDRRCCCNIDDQIV